MLYERWREVAASAGNEVALRDLASGRSWTFQQLAARTEGPPASPDRAVFPRGIAADFVLAVLNAWRHGQLVCPLEADQSLPPPLRDLPRGTVHLKTTSASAGPPRLVAFSAAQLAADADHIVQAMGLRPEWPNLAAISLAHSYGFSNLVLPLLLHGIPLWIADSPLPESVRRAARQMESLTLPAVPALWGAWRQANAIPPNVRLAISAGAPLPLALEQAVFAENHLKIHNFYGSSECGGIAFDPTPVPREDATTAGRPLPNVRLTIAPNGCLRVQGPAVGLAYWPQPDPALGRRRFHTSDLARMEDGVVHLLGRATDLINVAGRKVAPEFIERVIAAHPGVRECLVFGISARHHHRGEKIVACLALQPGTRLQTVRQFAMEQLPPWQVPREWRLVETLQPNGRGKISRREWKQAYRESGGLPSAD